MFLFISQIHIHFNPALGQIESYLWAVPIVTSCFFLERINLKAVLILLAICGILISSIINNLSSGPIFHDSVKSVWMPLLFVFSGEFLFNDKDSVQLMQNTFVFAALILTFVFFYRYLVLGEVREFDARPLLLIRHGDPNFLAFIFSIAYILSFSIKNIISKYFTLFIFAAATLATQSRMGVLALILATTFVILKSLEGKRKNQLIMLITLASLAFVIFLFFPQLLDRFENIHDKSNEERTKTWINGIILFLNNPWFGVGVDLSEKYLFINQGFPSFQSLEKSLTVHNSYLKLLSEIGLIGSLSFLVWYYLILKNWITSTLYSKALIFVLFFSSFFIGISFKDFYLLTLSLIGHKQTFEMKGQEI